MPECRSEESRETEDDRDGCQRQTSTGPLRVARLWGGKSSHIMVPVESQSVICAKFYYACLSLFRKEEVGSAS